MAPLQTLRRRSKLYDAAPNITTALETLRRPTKHYDAAPNFTMPLQTLWKTSFLQSVAPHHPGPLLPSPSPRPGEEGNCGSIGLRSSKPRRVDSIKPGRGRWPAENPPNKRHRRSPPCGG